MKTLTKALALCLAMLMIFSVPVGVSAAEAAADDALMDLDRTGSITIYKYDIVSSEKDGVWDDSYVSSGTFDQTVIDTLGGSRQNTLGNGETSNGYAIRGVEFTHLKIADIVQYTEAADDGDHVAVLYGIDKEKGADFLTAIGLEGGKSHYDKADATDKLDSGNYYYTSDTLIDALNTALEANSTDVKNALEVYVAANGGTAMSLTDEFGRTEATDLPLGLYLCLETKLPQQVVSSCLPFLVSVPMTSINATNTTDGGSRWIYDITLYPKNITGIPSLEKQLRESSKDTGKNNGSNSITDGYAHTGTASDGDVIEYQILSTLPSITSKATYLTDYTFIDTLSKGITYSKSDVVLEFYRDKACTDLVTRWAQGDGKFAVSYTATDKAESVMTIAMTEAGLNEINTAATVYTESGMVNSGYSDCTLRITYAATVNTDATVTYGDKGNPNDVVLSWRRSSSNYFDTLVDDCHIFVYGIDLTKRFSDGAGSYANVEFILHNDTDGYYVAAKLDKDSGIYYVTGRAKDKSGATRFVPAESGGNAGKIIIKGIEDDTYTATEVKTDSGYTLLRDDIEIVISQKEATGLCDIYSTDVLGLVQNDPRYTKEILEEAKEKGYIKTDGGLADVQNNMPQSHLQHPLLTASASVDGNKVNMLSDGNSANALAPLSVLNAKGFTLPKTGDNGVWMYGLVGILLMVGSIVAFVLFARKNRNTK